MQVLGSNCYIVSEEITMGNQGGTDIILDGWERERWIISTESVSLSLLEMRFRNTSYWSRGRSVDLW